MTDQNIPDVAAAKEDFVRFQAKWQKLIRLNHVWITELRK